MSAMSTSDQAQTSEPAPQAAQLAQVVQVAKVAKVAQAAQAAQAAHGAGPPRGTESTRGATIRPMSHGDIEALQKIDIEAHGQAWSRAAYTNQINDPWLDHRVAVDDTDRPIAHIATWIDGDTLRITNVACALAHSGQGIATDLLLEVLAPAAASSQISTISLEVRPGNRRAQRLYSRFGFVPVGTARGFYDRSDLAGNRDALVMRVDDASAPQWSDRLKRVSDQRRGSSPHRPPHPSEDPSRGATR